MVEYVIIIIIINIIIIALITIITTTIIIPETLHCFLWLAAASMHPASTVVASRIRQRSTPALLARRQPPALTSKDSRVCVCVCISLCMCLSVCGCGCVGVYLCLALCVVALCPLPHPTPPTLPALFAGGSPWRVTIASGCRSGAVVFPCLGRGMCLRSGACECSGGYLGASCQVACPGLTEEGTYCSGRGNCSSVKGDEDHGLLAICTCEYGAIHVCVCVCLCVCV